MNNDWLYRIGLTLIPGIGAIHAKSLVAYCGSAEEVFRQKKKVLLNVPGIGHRAASNITSQSVLKRAEKELEFIIKETITPLYYLEAPYPQRLKLCEDGPTVLYQKGSTALNRHRIIAMVGSRNATEYGTTFCRRFSEGLQAWRPAVVSGLAYGIDIASHKAALEYQLPTVAVLGHGLDRVYPALHANTAQKIVEAGGSLISEFISETKPDRENFPKRNRIIAGMSDAVIVVEAARKGGALITAEIANSYNRDVFAVPGRLGDTFSEGCHYLIKTHKAALLSGVKDLQYLLGWENTEVLPSVQKSLFVELEGTEKLLFELLNKEQGKMELDHIGHTAQLPMSKILPVLMTLELKGLVRSHPGKTYSLA